MTKAIYAVTVQLLLWAATLGGQQRTDWISTLTEPDIQYRPQIFDTSKVCYVEFQDKQQGSGPTTFDVAVDYTSTESNPNRQPAIKTDSEHITTTATQTGSSRIANCSGIVAARASFVRRH